MELRSQRIIKVVKDKKKVEPEHLHNLCCSICMGEINRESNYSSTDCQHYFHTTCLLKCVNIVMCEEDHTKYRKQLPCPLCRKDLYKNHCCTVQELYHILKTKYDLQELDLFRALLDSSYHYITENNVTDIHQYIDPDLKRSDILDFIDYELGNRASHDK